MATARRSPTIEVINVEGLQVTIVRKNVKNLNLRVGQDGGVRVSASPSVGTERIAAFVSQKRSWIERAIERTSDRDRMDARSMTEGATVHVWGRSLTCHIEPVAGIAHAYHASFDVEGGRLVARCGERCSGDDGVAQGLRDQMFERWLTDTLRNAVEREMWPCEELVGKRCSTVRLRRMKTRWGSCNTNTAAITLNTELVHYPPACLRYVIIHELCHLHEPNHGPRFHELMDGFCPDWRETRALLNLR